MSHGYQARVPKRLFGTMETTYFRVLKQNPSSKDLEVPLLIASTHGEWRLLKYYVEYALRHFPRKFSYAVRMEIQNNIVTTGDLRMLRWCAGVMFHIYGCAVRTAGEYGNIGILKWMQVGPEFWSTNDSGGMTIHWVVGAAEYAHVDVIEWAVQNNVGPKRILNVSLERISVETLDWFRIRFGITPAMVTRIEQHALEMHIFLVLVWLQKNFGTEYGISFVTSVLDGHVGHFELIKDMAGSGIRVKWDGCCLHQLSGPLREMCIYTLHDHHLIANMAAFEMIIEFLLASGASTSCEQHPEPMDLEEYRRHLIKQGKDCIIANTHPYPADSRYQGEDQEGAGSADNDK